MLTLKARAAELKEEQIRLKQMINEKNTATILVHLFAEGSPPEAVESCNAEDPLVEELLRRPVEAIPDSSQIPELPALILPGQHASKKFSKSSYTQQQQQPSLGDNIDYELLGRDRSQCTAEELDRIRRERNRMHAKRTRDRKRIYTERLSELCRQLENENEILHGHAGRIDPANPPPPRAAAAAAPPPPSAGGKRKQREDGAAGLGEADREFDHHIATLLRAAERELLHEISDAASSSSGGSSSGGGPRKKPRGDGVPNSIIALGA